MDADALLAVTLGKLDAIIAIVATMDNATANARPDVPGANSPYAILEHCLGMTRHWSGAVNRGLDLPRDREAEFTAAGTVEDLVARAVAVRQEFIADLRAVELDAAPAAPVTDARFWLGTCGGVLLHVLEELAQHLGHLELTRDLLAARTS